MSDITDLYPMLNGNDTVTCVFYLNGRTKSFTKESENNCWIEFKSEYGEALDELCKVKIIEENGTEIHLKPKDFLNQYVRPEHR